MEEKIIITFDEVGNPTIEVQGVKGKKCLELTKPLEDALGVVQSRQKKPEFYQRVTVEEHLRQGNTGGQ